MRWTVLSPAGPRLQDPRARPPPKCAFHPHHMASNTAKSASHSHSPASHQLLISFSPRLSPASHQLFTKSLTSLSSASHSVSHQPLISFSPSLSLSLSPASNPESLLTDVLLSLAHQGEASQSFASPRHAPRPGEEGGRRAGREPNPFMHGLDPSDPNFLASLGIGPGAAAQSIESMGSVLPPLRHDHAQPHMPFAQQYRSHAASSATAGYGPAFRYAPTRNGLPVDTVDQSARPKPTADDILESLLRESPGGGRFGERGGRGGRGASDPRYGHGSTHNAAVDPFAQLNALTASAPGGGLAAAAGTLWETWKYTIYVFLPGAFLMVVYYKFGYAEEIV